MRDVGRFFVMVARSDVPAVRTSLDFVMFTLLDYVPTPTGVSVLALVEVGRVHCCEI